jgi:hypothetical protein
MPFLERPLHIKPTFDNVFADIFRYFSPVQTDFQLPAISEKILTPANRSSAGK